MANKLSEHVNIGKDTERRLMQVGIESFEQLVELGSEQAFIRLQTLDPGACINLLYGLEGAIQNIKGNMLPAERKVELLGFYTMIKSQR